MWSRCSTSHGCARITATDLTAAIALTSPAEHSTAAWFCRFMSRLTFHGTLLIISEAIPTVFQQLRQWPTSNVVVCSACVAVFNIARQGFRDYAVAIRAIPDHKTLLIAAQSVNRSLAKDALAKVAICLGEDTK